MKIGSLIFSDLTRLVFFNLRIFVGTVEFDLFVILLCLINLCKMKDEYFLIEKKKKK